MNFYCVRSLGDIPVEALVPGARFAIPAGVGRYTAFEYRGADSGVGLSGIRSFFAEIGNIFTSRRSSSDDDEREGGGSQWAGLITQGLQTVQGILSSRGQQQPVSIQPFQIALPPVQQQPLAQQQQRGIELSGSTLIFVALGALVLVLRR